MAYPRQGRRLRRSGAVERRGRSPGPDTQQQRLPHRRGGRAGAAPPRAQPSAQSSIAAGPQRGTQTQRSGACREPWRRGRGRAEAVPRQPKQRPGPAALAPARRRHLPRRRRPAGPARGARWARRPRPSRCRRHEAPRTAAEANGGPGGAGGGANAGGAARAAAPGPAARLGVQVVSGANHREGCRGEAMPPVRGPAGPYYAARGEGSASGPGRGAAPCGAGAALRRRWRRPARGASPGLTAPGPAALPGPRHRLPGLLLGLESGLLPGWALRSGKAKLRQCSVAKCGLQRG